MKKILYVLLVVVMSVGMTSCAVTSSDAVKNDSEHQYILAFGSKEFTDAVKLAAANDTVIVESVGNYASALSTVAHDDIVELHCVVDSKVVEVQASHAAQLYVLYPCTEGIIFRDFTTTNTPKDGFFD